MPDRGWSRRGRRIPGPKANGRAGALREHALQARDELAARPEAVLRGLGQPALEDGVDRRGQRAVDGRRRRDRSGGVSGGLAGEALRHVRPAAGEQLERDDGERVAVARGGGGAPDGLLGGHVARRAENRPDARERESPAILAIPKSVTRSSPSPPSIRFAGFTSRWTTPWACAASSARPAWASHARASAGGTRPARIRSASVPPGRYSITIAGAPATSATSKIVTTFGSFESRAAMRASRLNRARMSGSRAKRSLRILIATRRSSVSSVAA